MFKSICFQAATVLWVLAIPRMVEPTNFLVGKLASALMAEGILWNLFRKQMIDSSSSVVENRFQELCVRQAEAC